jgi:hypothetical protein
VTPEQRKARLVTLDEEIRAIYAKRRPLTRAARLRSLVGEDLAFIDREIDEREIEEDALIRAEQRPGGGE